MAPPSHSIPIYWSRRPAALVTPARASQDAGLQPGPGAGPSLALSLSGSAHPTPHRALRAPADPVMAV